MRKEKLQFCYENEGWQNPKHPLYWYGYDFIGMRDGWIRFNKERYNECQRILENNGWIKWI